MQSCNLCLVVKQLCDGDEMFLTAALLEMNYFC